MLVNVFLYVPSILIQNRFSGSVLAVPLGVIIGTIFLYVYSLSIRKFPELGISEILGNTHKWFRLCFLVFVAIMWHLAGSITLLAFNDVTIGFINPDISGLHMIAVYTASVLFILLRLKTQQILYALEIVLVINIPLIFIIFIQAYLHNYLSWKSIMEVGTHFKELPSLKVLAASTFVFSGYINMIVFNRVFKEKIKVSRLWFIPFLGFVNLFTTLAIPIGFWGADGVENLTFPWVSTADALRIEYGPIERLITLFLLLYVSISLMSVIVHWHVAYEIIKNLIKIDKYEEKTSRILQLVILGCIGFGVILSEMYLQEEYIVQLGELWLSVRLPSEAFIVILMFWLARRKKE
jgi:hypothetical protein